MDRDVFNLTRTLEASQIAQYNTNGYLHLVNVIPPELLLRIRADIDKLATLKLKSLGAFVDRDLDRNIRHLEKISMIHGIDLNSATWRLQSFLHLASSGLFANIANQLLRTADLFLSACSLRYDQPGKDHLLIPWHQDYPFIQDSERSVVIWFPLFDLARDCGGVRVVPGSHRAGIQRVKPGDDGWLELVDPPCEEPVDSLVPHLNSGDILLMNTMTVHRSERNCGDRIRWTGQLRIGDFSDVNTIKRGWPRGMTQGQHFGEKHAEYITC